MANKVLSIYVGNDAIRVAEMQMSNKTVILSNAAEISTPDNAVNDGYIVDCTAVAEAIRASIFGRGFSTKDVIFTVTSKKIANKEVEIPYVKSEKKLQSILQANSGEYFPMSNSGDYSFAFSVLEDYTDAEGHKSRVSAIAAPYDLLKCYYELAEELKFNVKGIDYFGNSIIQLLSMQMSPGRVDLVLQIEKDATFVNVMRGKTLVLQRSVPYGKNAVTNALMDVKKISEKDAKTLLSNETLLEQHVTADEYAEAVQYLVSGIGRVVEYHRNKNQSDVLQGIKVFGEGSAIAGIEKILERELGAPVQHFETLSGVTIKGQAALTAEEVLRYLPNIGAVIKPVNLKIDTGSSGGISVDNAQIISVLRVVLAIAFVVMAAFTTITIVQNKKAKDKQSDLKKDIAKMQIYKDIRDRYYEASNQLAAIKDFKVSTNNDTEYLYEFFTALETVMPTESYINDVSIEDGKLVFVIKTGFHEKTKNEVADVLAQLPNLTLPEYDEEGKPVMEPVLDADGKETGKEQQKKFQFVSEFSVEEVEEEQEYRYLVGINEETGEVEYLREESKDDKEIGEYVLYEPFNDSDEEQADLVKKYPVVRLVQSKYEVECRLGKVTGEEE